MNIFYRLKPIRDEAKYVTCLSYEYLTTIISTRQFSSITSTKESLKGLENGQYVNDDIVLFYQRYDLHKFWAQCHSDYNISRVLYQNLMKNNPDCVKEIYIF